MPNQKQTTKIKIPMNNSSKNSKKFLEKKRFFVL